MEKGLGQFGRRHRVVVIKTRELANRGLGRCLITLGPPQGVGSQGIILDVIKQLGTRRRLRIFHPVGQVL